MTSLTMQNSWTAPTMLSLWTEPTPKRTKVVHQASKWVKIIDTTVTVLCPPVVSACAIFAAVVWPVHVHADLVGTAATPVANSAQTPGGAPGR